MLDRIFVSSITILFVGGMFAVFAMKPSFSVVRENHVAILKKLPDGDFAYSSDEEPNGGVFRPCESDIRGGIDVIGMLQAALDKNGNNYMADYAEWEERGTCKSIWKTEYGFWFKDKATNFEYRRISDASKARHRTSE